MSVRLPSRIKSTSKNLGTCENRSLRKTKDSRQGWIENERQAIRKRTLVNVPMRKVYREIMSIGLMPARCMNLVQWWYTDTIDFRHMNAKVMMKTLWMLGEECTEAVGLSAEGYYHWKRNYKMAWRVPCGPRMIDRCLDIQPLPSNHNEVGLRDNKTWHNPGHNRLRKLILYIIQKEGGLLKIIEQERKWRADAMTTVIKVPMFGNKSDYMCFPCENVPIVTCGFCGVHNVFSHINHNETLETKEEGTWRCGHCFADLDYELVNGIEAYFKETIFDESQGIHGGSQLDQLALLQYGDIYDDLNLEGRKRYTKEDMALVRKYFNNAYQTVMEIGHNLTREELEWLKSQFPRMTYICRPRSNTIGKMVDYELWSLIVDYNIKSMQQTLNVFGMYDQIYPLGLINNESISNSDIIVFRDELINVNCLIEQINGEKLLILPNIKNNTNHFVDIVTMDDVIYYTLGASGRVGMINESTFNVLINNNIIILDNCKLLIQYIEETANWIVLKLSILQTSTNTNNWKTLQQQPELTISLPMPNMDMNISNTQMQLWKTKEFKLDRQLLQMLCIRDLAGNLSFETLKEFAVGYALRTYSTRGKVMKNLAVTQDIVEIHVTLAKLLTLTMQSNTLINKNVMMLQEIPFIKSLIVNFANIITQTLFSHLKMSLSDVIGVNVITLIQDTLNSNSNLIQHWEQDNIFLEKLYTTPKIQLNPVKVIRLRKMVDYNNKCFHHVGCNCTASEDENKCICCKWAKPTDNSYCNCCQPITCQFIDDLPNTIELIEKPIEMAKAKPQKKSKIENVKQKNKDKLNPLKTIATDSMNTLKNSEKPAGIKDTQQYVTKENWHLSICYADPISYFHSTSNNNTKYSSTIDFNIKQIDTMEKNWYTIISYDINEEPKDLNCGRNALSKALNINLPIDLFLNNEDKLVTVAELMKHANDNKYNLVVIHSNGTSLVQNTPSKEFITLIHGSLIEGVNDDHFMPGKIKQTNLLHKYLNTVWFADENVINDCIRQIDSSMNINNIGHDEMLIVNMMVQKLTNGTIRPFRELIPKVEIINNKVIFTNNKNDGEHNIYNHKFHVEIRPELSEMYNLLAKSGSDTCNDISLRGYFDVGADDIDRLEDRLNDELRATIKQNLQVMHHFSQSNKVNHHYVRGHHNVTINFSNGYYTCKLPSTKIKGMDLGFINVANVRYVKCLFFPNNYNNTLTIIPDGIILEGKHKIYELKMSFSSTLRRLSSAGKINIPFTNIKNLIKTAKLITGGPGTGKTQLLVNNMTINDIAVGMTSRAVTTIKSRCKTLNKLELIKNVMSVERASTLNLILTGTLHVDEATQMSITTLVSIITPDTKNIVLYGDTSQIGYVDMFNDVAGERSNINLTDMIMPNNTTTLTNIRRYGGELAKQLKLIDPTVDGNPELNTQVKLVQLNGLDYKTKPATHKLILDFQIDVVLSSLTEGLTWLKTDEHNNNQHWPTNLEFSTTFMYQSAEANRVALIIKPNEQGSFGIGRHKKNIFSACSRAKELMLIIVINAQDTIENVADLVLVQGAGVSYSKSQFELPVEIQQQEATEAISYIPNASVNVTQLGEDLVYDIQGPFGITGKFTYNNGKIKIDSDSQLLKDQITANIDTNEIEIIDDMSRLESYNSTKLRALCWIIDKHIGQYFGIYFWHNLTKYKITKTKGCPYAAGIKVVRMNWNGTIETVLKITKNFICNYKYLQINHYDPFSQQIATWLELKTNGLTYDYGTTIFDSLEIPNNLDGLMLLDRLQRLPNCIASVMKNGCQYDQSCKNIKSSTTQRIVKLYTKFNISYKKLPELVVDHKYLVLQYDTIISSYGILINNMNKINVVNNTSMSNHSKIKLWSMLLTDIPHYKSKNLPIKGELDGLNMSLEKHKEHKTEVYYEYSKKMSQLTKYNSGGLDSTIWVTTGREINAKLLIKNVSDYIYINSHNQHINIPLAELMDGMMLLKDGSIDKSATIVYAGSEPVLPSLYNKHYIKLYYNELTLDKIGVTKRQYMQAINQVESFLSGFASEELTNTEQLATKVVINNLTGSEDTILLGSSLNHTPLKEIINMLELGCKKIVGWAVTSQIDERLGKITNMEGNYYLTTARRHLETPLEVDTIFLANNSNIIQLKNGKYVSAIVTDYMLGFNYVSITAVNLKPKMIIQSYAISSGDTVTIQLPWLNTTIKAILETKKIFITKTLTIKPYLFRSICMRLLARDNTTLDDVLAYTRTLGSAYETSETNFRMKYSIDVSELRSTAYAAWYYHKQYTKQFSAFKWLYNNLKDKHPAVITNVLALIRDLAQALVIVSDAAETVINDLNSILNEKLLDHGLDLNILGKTDDDLKIMFSVDTCKLIPTDDSDDDDNSYNNDNANWNENNEDHLKTLHNLKVMWSKTDYKLIEKHWKRTHMSTPFSTIHTQTTNVLRKWVIMETNQQLKQALRIFLDNNLEKEESKSIDNSKWEKTFQKMEIDYEKFRKKIMTQHQLKKTLKIIIESKNSDLINLSKLQYPIEMSNAIINHEIEENINKEINSNDQNVSEIDENNTHISNDSLPSLQDMNEVDDESKNKFVNHFTDLYYKTRSKIYELEGVEMPDNNADDDSFATALSKTSCQSKFSIESDDNISQNEEYVNSIPTPIPLTIEVPETRLSKSNFKSNKIVTFSSPIIQLKPTMPLDDFMQVISNWSTTNDKLTLCNKWQDLINKLKSVNTLKTLEQELTETKVSDTLRLTGKNHVLIVITGSTGEIIPLVQFGQYLLNTNLYDVTVYCQKDIGLKLPENMGWMHFNLNTLKLQQKCIEMINLNKPMEALLLAQIINEQILKSLPKVKVTLVVANVITYAAGIIRQHYKCNIILTSAALERISIFEQIINMLKLGNTYNIGKIMQPMLTTIYLNEYGIMLSQVDLPQIENKQSLIYGLYPNKWNDLYTKKQKYNQIGFWKNNNLPNVVNTNDKMICKHYLITGSNFANKWRMMIKAMHSHWANHYVIIAISHNDAVIMFNCLLNELNLQLPALWDVQTWINYNLIVDSTIITHGGAGVLANLTTRNNRYILHPMIGDNFANAVWMKAQNLSINVLKPDQCNKAFLDIELLPMSKIEYEYNFNNYNELITQQLVHQELRKITHCTCNRQHVLVHFIGTRGDINSIVPATIKLFNSAHVVCVTHHDLMKDIPTNWVKHSLHRSSKDCAEVAAETMDLNNMRPIDGLINYRSMVVDSNDILNKLHFNFEYVITNMFTPLSTVIGVKFTAQVIYVDAIPNRLFYVNNKEIATKLPLKLSETGNALRHSILENVDKTVSKLKDIKNPLIEIVTCHKNLYMNFLKQPDIKHVYNLLVNDEPTNNRQSTLTIPKNGFKVLITFGSIPTPHRLQDVLTNMPETYYIYYSGIGNAEKLNLHTNYISELNYPMDLKLFDVVVHHGGVGTTWNCIKAGVPQLIWPIFGDQFIWASYVEHYNIGKSVLNFTQLKNKLEHYRKIGIKTISQMHEQTVKLSKNYQDDYVAITDILGLEKTIMTLEQKQLWIKTTNNNNWDTKEDGQYIVKYDNVEVLHDPSVPNYCTWYCLQKLIPVDSAQSSLWKNPDVTTLKGLLMLNNINYVIIDEDGVGHMYSNNNNINSIQLQIIHYSTHKHCKLINSHLGSKELIAFKVITEKDTYSSNLLDEISKLGEECKEIVANNNEAKLAMYHKLNKQNLQLMIRMIRQEEPLKTVKLLKVEGKAGTFLITGSKNIKSDAVYYTNNTLTLQPAIFYTVVCHDRALLINITNNEIVGPLISIIRIETNFTSTVRPKPQIVEIKGWVFINNETRRANKLKKYKDKPVYNNDRTYKLIVNFCDNQQHDKFNCLTICENAQEIALPPDVTKEDFDTYFMSEYFEVLVWNRLYVDLNFQPTNLIQTTYLKALKSSQVINKFDNWYKEINFNMAANHVGPVKVKQYTWIELVDKLHQGTQLRNQLAIQDDQIFEYDSKANAEIILLMPTIATAATWIGNNKVLVTEPLAIYTLIVKGAGLTNYSWEIQKDIKTTNRDWWGLFTSPITTTLQQVKHLINVEPIAMQTHSNVYDSRRIKPLQGKGSGMAVQKIEPNNMNILHADKTENFRMPCLETMIFWEDTELIDWMSMYAPEESKLTSTEWGQQLIKSTKHTLTKYPKQSRPVHTKISFEEHKSIAGRLFNVKRIRTKVPSVDVVMSKIYTAFFHDQASQMVSQFKSDKLYFNTNASVNWLEQHKRTDVVYEDLKKFLDGNMITKPMSDIKVHMKLESLLKETDKIIKRWEQQKARIIVWQAYAVAAIFSPIFTEAKKRLHKLFNNKILYADGKTPDQLSSFIRGTGTKTKYVACNDASQQDRQTDEPLINVEQYIYMDLGVSQDVINCWITVHKDWRFKGMFTKGWRHSMRTTGQATTAIGNAITTMQCNADFIINNKDNLNFMLILGDDNAMGLTQYINMKSLKRQIAEQFNMITNPLITRDYGEFCGFLIYKTVNNYWELGPDYVRLKNKYEVTNGVSEVTEINMKMRAMSYIMMLGKTKEAKHIIKKLNLPIQPEMWYSQSDAVKGMCLKHNLSEIEVNDEYSQLIDMLTHNKVYEHSLTILTSKPRKM